MYISKINTPLKSYNVSFGQDYPNPAITDNEPYGYNVSHKFGALRSGRCDYDKSSGNNDIRLNGFLPFIKRRELYYPSKETEVTMKRNLSRVKKVTVTPTATVTQIFDRPAILKENKDFSVLDSGALDYKNGEIFRLTETTMGSKYLLRYDKALNRRIYIEDKPEGRKVRITDTKTGEKITSGERIYDKYTNDDGEEIIENLLTGKVVQRTQFRYKSSKIQHQEKYYENSDRPKYIYDYDYATGKETEKFLSESGSVTRLEIGHPSNKNKEIYTYDNSGNILTHTKEIYGFGMGKKKPIARKIIFNPENNDIVRTIDNKNNETIITQYTSSEKTGENNPATIEYLKDKKLHTFEILQNRGKYVLSRIEFNKFNEVCYEKFDKKGNIKSANYFDKTGNITTAVDFIPNSERLASVTKYKPNNKGYSQYIYSRNSKYPVNIIRVDENNQTKKTILNLDSNYGPKELSTPYFENGDFNYDWHNRAISDISGLPALPKSRQEAISLTNELKIKAENAFQARKSHIEVLD